MNRSRLETGVQLLRELDRYTIFTATAVFTLLAGGVATGEIHPPGGMALLLLYPIGLVLIRRLMITDLLERELYGAATWSVLIVVALEFVPELTDSPLVAVALLFLLAAALAVARWPAGMTAAAALFSAVLGTFQAFLGFSPSTLIDLILAAIWIALAARAVLGREAGFVVWPAMLGFGLYVALSAVDLLTSDDIGVALTGFRATVWYMLAIVVIAYSGWSQDTYRRLALGIVGIAAAVGAYATVAWVFGPTGAERELALVSGNGINVDPVDKHLRTVGSFLTGHQLAFWTALIGPFCFAITLWARGWGRSLAIAATVLCFLGMVASEARGPVGGFIAGVVVIMLLNQGARAFPGFKPWILAIALVGVAAVGTTAAILDSEDPDRLERYANILDPGSDETFNGRQLKWDRLIPAIDDEPFGHGIGTGAGGEQIVVGNAVEQFNIDNSYLKVAYEQGWFIMGLFGATMLGLFAHLGFASARTHSRQAAAIGMGACGTLISILVSFYTGLYIEATPVLTAWLIVGLGLSQFVRRPAPAAEPVEAEPRRGGLRPPVPVTATTTQR